MVFSLCVRNQLPLGLPRIFSGFRTLASVVQEAPTTSESQKKESTGRFAHGGRVSDRIMELSREAVTKGEPHFRVGGKQLFFPKARIILLRPNAKHTPYQAKFIVPKSFNKLDLRDYLFHVYGLRAMNVTTQLLHGKYTRVNIASSRFRGPQIKKMTIDMAEPFIWPEEPKKEENSAWNDELIRNLELYRDEQQRLASDSFKPGKAFDGAVGPFRPVAQPFVPKQLGRQIKNKRRKYQSQLTRSNELLKVGKYVDL
ncbi:hypothetical protein ZYGR_0AK05070 [Zygosaccharomyces rouxii]|uniref:Large ribosomal subunit protein uL23m n=1 Tax=Zygosaccharomyces rouxii TaxID=4956 RepID=A0A1Q3AEF4_ZYGRO|nr:hypothetical protein ZYGR_0AK05070 [Zygosaccharomyces rouxii]